METKSLWGDLFDVNESKEKTKKIINKVKAPKPVKELSTEKLIKSKNISSKEKIQVISDNVSKVLGKQINNVSVIKTRQQLTDYISKAINNKIISIDTETNNSLDPITCKLMGLCLYTPNEKQVYVPINHIDIDSKEKLPWQLTENDIKEELQRINISNIDIIMHNGKFDYQVLKCTCGIEIKPTWDTLIASKLIDENEGAGLKEQYILHIDSDQEKYSIEKLFENQEYSIFPPEVFALYAATDSLMTYRLYYEYQKPIMESNDFTKIYKLFKEVEMPCVIVTAEMELNGVEVNLEYAERLSKKYHNKLDEIDAKVQIELDKLKPQIDAWKCTEAATIKPTKKNGLGVGKSKAEQLDNPINLASPTQLAILFYDILKVPQVSKKSPRGTGEEEMELISKQNNIPLCNVILERRECVKLLSTYIDNIPELAKIWDDHRLRSHFSQYGTDTGRFSSGGKIKYRDKNGNAVEVSGINYQNIPSHSKDIRPLFKAKDGYVLVGNDWSQQEPRLLSFMSQDKGMMGAYLEGKDLYATIAMGVYHNNYWDNMEHYEDGSPNPEGKKRRGNCKQVLLGISYGLGVPSLAERMGLSIKEAQTVMDDFYKAFPQVKAWQDKTIQDAIKFGYVEDIWGRRRRLPSIQLPQYEFKLSSNEEHFNPFICCSNINVKQESPKITKFKKMLSEDLTKTGKAAKVAIQDTISRALQEGVIIIDNSGKLVHARNQCVNARIQGSAATMTKKAMIKIYNDTELRELNFKLLIGVHDELIGECPIQNSDKVADRLCNIMRNIVSDDVTVPFNSDAEIEDYWYQHDLCNIIQSEYKEYLKMGLGVEAKYRIYKEHSEMTHEQLDKILN